jgi:hypothetical protein
MADSDLIVEGLNVSAAERRIKRSSREWIGDEGNLVFDEALLAIAILKHYFGEKAMADVPEDL